jgi:hypothetical protein
MTGLLEAERAARTAFESEALALREELKAAERGAFVGG